MAYNKETHRHEKLPCRGCGKEKVDCKPRSRFCNNCAKNPLERVLLLDTPCRNGHVMRQVGMHRVGPKWYCKGCEADRAAKKWADPDSREKNRISSQIATMRRKYGLQVEQWDAMYEAQNGICPICQNALKHRLETEGRAAAVDHDHKTGLIRGLLCRMPCNYALGVFRDNTANLLRAAEYVNNPPANAVIGQHVVPPKPKRKRKKTK